ncbi:hyaluronan and proteoglycan link protein 1-like isoform X1 [Syngnathoides biaculeatus]|uniref:hyaluronan and proteoglycan link protein 1-like isoform X1 n=1 Tax=Syngnathoides biaculeatus TaxID=300417 RepID=UPI002ADD94D5|nr:hyaluronan and proteoglycan link protein 1-like isoform X1 [Syngnathoides biaculeatus]
MTIGAIPALILALTTLSAADGSRSRRREPEVSRSVRVTENAPSLSATSQPSRVLSRRGADAALPCAVHRDRSPALTPKMRIKWTKLTSDFLTEVDVLAAVGSRERSYGRFRGRVRLRGSSPRDASLLIRDVALDDYGRYKCEVVDGLEDAAALVSLDLEGEPFPNSGRNDGNVGSYLGDPWKRLKPAPIGRFKAKTFQVRGGFGSAFFSVSKRISGPVPGVVFPYFPRTGRYKLTFRDAERACREQDGAVASPEQLRRAWRGGLNWCNAGWLSDGSVRYPVTSPREPCGGGKAPPGVRSYGPGDKDKDRYDVFCFTSHFKGEFYFLPHAAKLTFAEAAAACERDGARLAKVGQMYAAWKLAGYDRCDAGWLHDASVRYPIARPRPRCGPDGPVVGFVGFPDEERQRFGVYCFRGGH